MSYQILNYRDIKNFLHQAKVEICGFESWDYSMDEFSEKINQKVNEKAKALCDEYNLIVKKNNELIEDRNIHQKIEKKDVSDFIYEALLEHEDNRAVFNEITKSFSQEGIVVIQNTAKMLFDEFKFSKA